MTIHRLAGRADERGSMSIELLILTPALVAAILVIVAGSRYAEAREETNSAAFAAARAASLAPDASGALAAGRAAAVHEMSDRGLSCARLDVNVDTHDFAPGGTIRVTVTCVTDLGDLSGFVLMPGHKSFRSTATVPLDQHRSFS
jgi:Flp pilus assembly protein TadG